MIKRAVQSFLGGLENDWPVMQHEQENEPHFIFLLTLPFSGSTAMAKVFQSSSGIDSLLPNGEGQWLVKGLCGKDRWRPEKEINGDSVKSVWLRKYQSIKRRNPAVSHILEKSPPNILRIDLLRALFQESTLLANNRNPYASCSSFFYRTIPKSQIASLDFEGRQRKFTRIASLWQMRSRILRAAIDSNNIRLITYEQFVSEPSLLQDFLSDSESLDMLSLNWKKEFVVKDYQSSGVKNFNEEQIARLSFGDIEAITMVLRTDPDLLDFFGYDLRGE